MLQSLVSRNKLADNKPELPQARAFAEMTYGLVGLLHMPIIGLTINYVRRKVRLFRNVQNGLNQIAKCEVLYFIVTTDVTKQNIYSVSQVQIMCIRLIKCHLFSFSECLCI